MATFNNRNFASIMASAIVTGRTAAEAAQVQPMTVVEADVLTGQPLPNAMRYHVPDGVCGFAWVSFKGNTAFGRWAKKTGKARPAYGGGLQYWVADYNQSMQRKEAHANAMAEALRASGIEAYANSRMD